MLAKENKFGSENLVGSSPDLGLEYGERCFFPALVPAAGKHPAMIVSITNLLGLDVSALEYECKLINEIGCQLWYK